MAEVDGVVEGADQAGHRLDFLVYRGREGLAALEPAWERIAARLDSRKFCHLHVWYRHFLASLAEEPEGIRFLLLRRHGVDVAIFPLRLAMAVKRRLAIRTLEIPHHPHMNLTDFVFEKSADNADLARELLAYLRSNHAFTWDVLYLPLTATDSAVSHSMRRNSPPRRITDRRGSSNFIPCAGTYSEVTSRLAGSFRRNLRRLTRRAQESGMLTYRYYRGPDELEEAFALFLEVEGLGWKGAGGTRSAIRFHPELLQFYRGLMRESAQTRSCIINLLFLGETCIAGQYCLLVDGVLHILKIGYNERFAHLSPGNLLIDQVLRAWSGQGEIRGISFVLDAPWTAIWQPESIPVFDHYICNTTWRGWAVYSWHRARALMGIPAASARANDYRAERNPATGDSRWNQEE